MYFNQMSTILSVINECKDQFAKSHNNDNYNIYSHHDLTSPNKICGDDKDRDDCMVCGNEGKNISGNQADDGVSNSSFSISYLLSPSLSKSRQTVSTSDCKGVKEEEGVGVEKDAGGDDGERTHDKSELPNVDDSVVVVGNSCGGHDAYVPACDASNVVTNTEYVSKENNSYKNNNNHKNKNNDKNNHKNKNNDNTNHNSNDDDNHNKHDVTQAEALNRSCSSVDSLTSATRKFKNSDNKQKKCAENNNNNINSNNNNLKNNKNSQSIRNNHKNNNQKNKNNNNNSNDDINAKSSFSHDSPSKKDTSCCQPTQSEPCVL